MTKKQKIIVISVMLSIFVIAMIIIAVFQYKKNTDILEEPTTQSQFAEQEVKDSTTEETTEDVSTENVELRLGDQTVTHLERLTSEQGADKSAMFAKVASRASKDSDKHGKIVAEDILDSSFEYRVFVEVTFEDGEKITYVCGYDATNMHKFLRCVSLEEWEAEQNGANAG